MCYPQPIADSLRHHSFRLPESLLQQLRRVAERRSTSQTALVQRYIEEGLRMEAHPMIVFRDGALGRRAMLAGTRLEVVHVLETVRNSETLEDAAEYLSLGVPQVRACLQYYAEYQAELDEYSARLEAENERLRQQWELEQALLAR